MLEPLYPYQSEAVNRIASDEQLYLGFDPGLGKSRTALEALLKRGARRILVICLASGRYVWEREAKKWAPHVPCWTINGHGDLRMLQKDGIVILTYGLLSIKNSPFVAAVAGGENFDGTILDEAAAVKNPGSNRTKAILGKMLQSLGYVLPLSGTPAPNHAGELYPILKALWPRAITSGGKPMAQWEFENVFCKVTQKRFGTGPSVRVIEGSKNIPELKKRLDGFMVRIHKADVLKDLPPVRYDVVPIGIVAPASMPTLPVEIKDDDDFLKYLTGRTGDDHIARVRRMLGFAKIIPSAEYIDDFLTNLPARKKVIVFAHHREVIERLLVLLADWQPVSITGASTPQARGSAINAFLTDPRCRLLVGNIQAMGMGLTLVGPNCDCSDVIFVEASYVPADNVQAAARVHRIGQREAVVARFLTAHGTIDSRIQAITARKAAEFAQLFG